MLRATIENSNNQGASMHEKYALSSAQLYTPCRPEDLPFDTSDELPDLGEEFAHGRAVEALHFGLDIRRPGYNLFVLGDPGSGRHAMVRRLIETEYGNHNAPADWCYVNNFTDARRPRLLSLPAGRGAGLRDDMQRFVGDLGAAITAAFESDAHRLRIEALQQEYREREEHALRELGHEAVADRIALVRTPEGFSVVPMKDDQETMSSEEFDALPAETQRQLNARLGEFQEKLHKLVLQFPRWRRETQDKLKQASRDALQAAVGHLIEELRSGYQDLPEVQAFFGAVEKDVVEVGDSLRESQKTEGEMEFLLFSGNLSVQRYLVNLLVDNAGQTGRPLIYEDHPTFQNLVGRVEHLAHMGMLVSNFTLIKAGALHRANGGYLVLDAERLLMQPFAWDGLKRILKSGEIRIDSLGEMYGLASTQQLEPQPIPLDLKVVLVGERMVYYLLAQLDTDFAELFKVAADFESEIERSAGNTTLYARLLATLARRAGLRPLLAEAAARLIEHAARLAEDAERLTTDLRRLTDLLTEADYRAGKADASHIARCHVEEALAAQDRRLNRIRQAQQSAILRDTLLIATVGSHVGQINGLAAAELGDFVFAHPMRITATVRMGDGEMVDIEREVELGGPIHSKGVLILSAFLAARFGRLMPLSLNASIVFEQSYGDVEGDSASLAELCALISALGGIPIKQSLAVTGSVNQYGMVQPIGAVNEKIEGFFDICRARGLDGRQGVVIPTANVKHLMLRQDVVQAVADGQFHIYAVADFDSAIEILTDVPVGEPDQDGTVPAGTVNFLVAATLAEMAAIRQDFADGGQQRQQGKKKKAAAPKDDGPPKVPPK
ncbi:MAG: ATP-dependent protease [Rhodocyclaceae bacterium]|nr:ATP-dependent protease [Rhodocyclaceae bacterium]